MEEKTKKFLLFLVGILCVIYLANFGFGIIDILPDNLPLIGNLDEAGITVGLVRIIDYFKNNR